MFSLQTGEAEAGIMPCEPDRMPAASAAAADAAAAGIMYGPSHSGIS